MNIKRFGTFDGVFTPTALSILGVIMYLRLGWVVGEVGLGNALIIILISNAITLFTGLSVASITTNIKIGAGGAYSIISKSLGLEVGGAIGIPLYLSQAISVAFYITGFSECWSAVFPQHSFILISLVTWLFLLIISYLSAKLAFRLQFIIMAIIVASLVSAFLGTSNPGQSAVFLRRVSGGDFWKVFAIFFPAVTGILAGVSMSGELKEPQRSIPRGTLWAIGITFIIYTSLAFWFARSASPQQLITNTSIIIDLSRWRFLVIAGIMGATLSSALSMLVASPRTLFALGKHRLVPFASSFEHINKRSEPTTAILFTALVALFAISLGNLNNIAGILTMFFLITYGTLNLSVFIEKITGIVSFRPTFRIPLIFSLLGGIGCIYAMFLINPIFSIIAIAVTILIYIILLRREVRKNWPDIRKGIFIFIAEQAIKVASSLPYHPKIWKPNLLIPIDEPKDLPGIIEFVRAVTFPRGRVDFLKIIDNPDIRIDAGGCDSIKNSAIVRGKITEELSFLSAPLKEEGIFVSTIVTDCSDFLSGSVTVMQTLKGLVLAPNVLFLKLGLTQDKDMILKDLIAKAASCDLGVMILRLHPKVGFGQKRFINLWIRRGSPNVDLAILVSLQLQRNWETGLRLIQIVPSENEQKEAKNYLSKFKKVMRLPRDLELNVVIGRFEEAVSSTALLADVNIFGMSEECNIAWMRTVSDKVNTSALFLRDSTQEKAVV